ncbi:hypothetical protein N9917_00200 [Deltaproteobacteria bacterium]|nr:hypothetical protein [Deltaproteobacteria bacterium]
MAAHHIEIIPTDLIGIDSGRTRYRVICHTCQVEVHRATTGPVSMTRGHFDGEKGYERPLAKNED